MSKQRRKRIQQKPAQQQRQRNIRYAVATVIGLLIIGALYFINASGGLSGSMVFRDIHGMNFTPDGELYGDFWHTEDEVEPPDTAVCRGRVQGHYHLGKRIL